MRGNKLPVALTCYFSVLLVWMGWAGQRCYHRVCSEAVGCKVIMSVWLSVTLSVQSISVKLSSISRRRLTASLCCSNCTMVVPVDGILAVSVPVRRDWQRVASGDVCDFAQCLYRGSSWPRLHGPYGFCPGLPRPIWIYWSKR